MGGREVKKFLAAGRVNRVVLLSDGIANVGPSSPSELAALGRELAAAGVSVSTIGLGLGYNEDLMSQLAAAADGNHAFVEHADQLASIVGLELGDALAVVAKDVSVELEFAKGVRPVRALGRAASFEGQRVVAKLGSLGVGQARYLLVEAEVSGAALSSERVELARARARFFDTAAEGARAVESALGAQVVKSVEEMRASEVGGVMEEVLVLLSVEKQKLAVQMKDRGDSAGASRAMAEGASMLSQGARRYKSKKLEAAASEAASDSEEIKKDGASWTRLRKAARSKAHKAATQQAY